MTKVLIDEKQNYGCLFCSITEKVFGPVFHLDEDDPEDFIDWLRPTDARRLSDTGLVEKISEWRNVKILEKRKCSYCHDEFYKSQSDAEDPEIFCGVNCEARTLEESEEN